MVRMPSGWAFHAQGAKRAASMLGFGPGWNRSGQRPITRPPITRYRSRISGVPLTGGQQQGTISAGGTCTLSVGPQALGTVWYPTQLTISTTTGLLDTSTAMVYVGSGQVPNQLVATVFTGNGLVAQVPSQMSPGQTLIVAWTGGHAGDVAAINIVGTMDALAA